MHIQIFAYPQMRIHKYMYFYSPLSCMNIRKAELANCPHFIGVQVFGRALRPIICSAIRM